MIRVALGSVETLNEREVPNPKDSGESVAASPSTEVTRRGMGLSFREFLDECSPKSDPQRVTAAVSFLSIHRHVPKVDRVAVEAAFREAGETIPGNTRDGMLNAKRAGWIAPNPGVRSGY